MSNEVLSKIDADGNATVVLNRPEVHNAFDPAMTRLLTETLRKLDANAKVRAVTDRKSTRLNSSHTDISRMPSSA